MKLFLAGNVLDAAVCYQKAIEQDSNKLANRVVCIVVLHLVKKIIVKCFSQQFMIIIV